MLPSPRMGVTAHFFAFDPRVQATPPTIDRWVSEGALDSELEVTPPTPWLRAILTPLGDNKRWYDNLAGDFAWLCVRKHVAPELRVELDAWLSHLFWDADGEGCPCGRAPTAVAEHEVVYDHALLEHILSLERPLDLVEPALALEFDGDPPKTERLHRPWIYDFGCFRDLVLAHQRIFKRATKAGRGWSLLRWVWH